MLQEITSHIEKYSNNRSIFEVLTKRTLTLIEELLSASKIKVQTIEGRTKTIDSFKEKVASRINEFKGDVKEITDLSGIRIITYYIDDVDKIIEVIKNEFDVDTKNTIDKRNVLEPNEFGYLSVHYVVQHSKKRLRLQEWKQFKGLKTEIQIRTVLQHSWASISHELQYKVKHDVPSSLQRKLFRLASIIELADEEFLEVREQHLRLKESVEKNFAIDNGNFEINLLTTKKFLNTSKILDELYSLAKQSGFKDFTGVEHFDEEFEESFDENKSASQLNSLMKLLHVNSIKKITTILRESKKTAASYFLKQTQSSGNEWYIAKDFVVTLILILKYCDEIAVTDLVELGWNDKIAERTINTAKKFKKK